MACGIGKLLEEIHSYWDGRPEKVHVLDVGTGPGFFAVILAENHYQVTAVDYTEAMLAQARKNAGELAEQICWRGWMRSIWNLTKNSSTW